jgi:prevent-host-death family protein
VKTVPLSEAKDKLSGLVDDAESTHEIITITKHGRAAAVLIAADDLDSLRETVFWLSMPGIADTIAEADTAIAAADTVGSDELRRRLGLPER